MGNAIDKSNDFNDLNYWTSQGIVVITTHQEFTDDMVLKLLVDYRLRLMSLVKMSFQVADLFPF